MKLYTDVLAHSWAITTKHSHLWIFGLFAALIVGIGGAIDKYLRYVQNILNQVNVLSPEFWQRGAWASFIGNIISGIQAGDFSTAVFAGLLLAAIGCLVYMMMVAEGALIYTASLDRKQPIKFIEAFLVGHRHAGPLFFLNTGGLLLLMATVYAMSVIAVNSPWSDTWYEVDLLTMLLSGIALIPVVFITIFTSQYAANYIVLRGAHLWSAIGQGAKLFFKNWLVTFELSVVIFGLALGLNIGLVLAVFIVMAPYAVAALVFSSADQASIITSASFIGGLAYLIGLLLFASLFGMWQWGAWTNVFTRLLKEKHTGKIIRLLQA